MKTFKDAVVFQFRMYLVSNKILVPFIVLVAFLYFNYNQRPVDIVANYIVSAVVCFYLMFWIGLAYNEVTDLVTEQLLVLKIKGHTKYYLCNDVVLCMIAGIFGTAAVAYSFIAYPEGTIFAIGDIKLLMNIIFALLLHLATSFTGAMTGALFHGRIFHDKKVMMCLALILAIIGIAKDLVDKAIGGFRFVSFVFPPVAEFIKLFRNAKNLHMLPVVKGILIMLVYGISMVVIKEIILVKRKF